MVACSLQATAYHEFQSTVPPLRSLHSSDLGFPPRLYTMRPTVHRPFVLTTNRLQLRPPPIRFPTQTMTPSIYSKTGSLRVQLIQNHFASASPRSALSTIPSEPLVLARTDANLRILTLNRPSVLNALNVKMTSLLTSHLIQWERSPEANLVILNSEGRAFCAGGDVVALIEAATSGQPEKEKLAAFFFQQEYCLNNLLAKMETPVICFMDGITMGGGLGLSMHVPFRIATENTRVAMPETAIGLFPDVGATFFLPRMDGELGTYLGLTGTNLYGWGAFQAGIASHYVASASLPALQDRLASMSSNVTHERINEAINEFSADIVEGTTSSSSESYDLVGVKREAIDHCFGAQTVEDILQKLESIEKGALFTGEDLEKWAKETREKILARSPRSCKITLMALRDGRKLDIDECFAMELKLAATCSDVNVHPDFATGVKHLLVSKLKTRAPWKPSNLPEIPLDTIRQLYFSSAPSATTHYLPPIYIPTNRKPYKSYPYAHYALPSEQTIKEHVVGNTKDSGSFALTEKELVSLIQRKWQGKIGVAEKVLEVLRRKTTVGGQNEGKVLKWVY